MALNVVCCVPVASSPEACARPAGVKVPNTSGMPPVALKKLVSALATFCWLTLSPAYFAKYQIEIEKDVVGVVAQAGLEAGRNTERIERAEGAADAAGRGQDGVLLRHIIAGEERRARAAVQRRGAGHIGKRRRRGIELHQIQRAGLEREIAGHGHR